MSQDIVDTTEMEVSLWPSAVTWWRRARSHGVSRYWIYKLLKRFREGEFNCALELDKRCDTRDTCDVDVRGSAVKPTVKYRPRGRSMSATMRTLRTCPSCGAARVVPIVYDEPKAATVRAAELGFLRTWGCLVYDDLPRWAWLECEHRWGRLDDADTAVWNGAIGSAMRRARATV